LRRTPSRIAAAQNQINMVIDMLFRQSSELLGGHPISASVHHKITIFNESILLQNGKERDVMRGIARRLV
jgi:hypothetical protein